MFFDKLLRQVWKATLLICIVPFVILGFYTHPSIHDDYLNANSILESDGIEFVKKNYFNWTGRYTELLLKAFCSPLMYKNAYLLEKILSISMLACMLMALLFLCHTIYGKKISLQLSLLLFVMLLAGFANISSVFYWSGGATAYTAGIILSIIFVAFLFKLKQTNKILNLFICCILVFLATGCYEVIMMAMLWITFTSLVYAFLSKKGVTSALVLFIFNFASALLVVLSPGNAARAASIKNTSSILSVSKIFLSMLKSLFFASGSIVTWLNSLLLILGTLIVLRIINKERNINFFLTLRIPPLLGAVWVIAGISLTILPSIIAYQAVWVHTWQCVYFFFFLGWLLFASSLFQFLNEKHELKELLLNRYFNAIIKISFIVIVLIGSSSNVNVAYLDVLKAPEYQRRALKRDLAMQKAALSGEAAELNPLFLPEERYKIPQTLYTLEYNEADAQAFSRYYHVNNLIVNKCSLLK